MQLILAATLNKLMSKSMKESTNTMKIRPYSLKKDQPQVTLKHLPLSNLLAGPVLNYDYMILITLFNSLLPPTPAAAAASFSNYVLLFQNDDESYLLDHVLSATNSCSLIP